MRRNGSVARIGLVLAIAALVIAVAVTTSGAKGDAPATPGAVRAGLAYGGHVGEGRDIWLRVSPDRRRIASLVLDWEAPASACTNREDYTSTTWTGGEYDHPIAIHGRAFHTRVIDSATMPGGLAAVETLTIDGTFATDWRSITAVVSGAVTARRSGGGGYTCTLAPTRMAGRD